MFRPPPKAGATWKPDGPSSSAPETHALEIEQGELFAWACALVGASAVPTLQLHPDPAHPAHYRDGRLAVELVHRLVKLEADYGVAHPDANADTTYDRSLEGVRHLRHLRRNGTPAERWRAAVDAVTEANTRGTDASPDAALLHVRVAMPSTRELCLGTPPVVAIFLFVAFHVYVVRPRLALVPTMARWFGDVVSATYDDDDPRIAALAELAATGTNSATAGKAHKAHSAAPWYCAQSAPTHAGPFGNVTIAAGPSAITAAFGDGVLLLLALRGASLADCVEARLEDPGFTADDLAQEVMSLETCFAAPYLFHVGDDDPPPPATDGDAPVVGDPLEEVLRFREHRHELVAANAAMLFAALEHFGLPSFFDSAADFVSAVEADAARAARCTTFLFMLAFSVFERFAESMVPMLAQQLAEASPPLLPLPVFADSDAFAPVRPPVGAPGTPRRPDAESSRRDPSDADHDRPHPTVARIVDDAELDAYVNGARERVAVVLELSPDGREPPVPARTVARREVETHGSDDGRDSMTNNGSNGSGQSARVDLGLGLLPCQLLVSAKVCALADAARLPPPSQRIVLAAASVRVEVERSGRHFAILIEPPTSDAVAPWHVADAFVIGREDIAGVDVAVAESSSDSVRGSGAKHSVVTVLLQRLHNPDGTRRRLVAAPPPYDAGTEPTLLLRFANADDAVILHTALSQLL